MELVTERDMRDAKGLGDELGLLELYNWDEMVHDLAQAIANGRRPLAHIKSED